MSAARRTGVRGALDPGSSAGPSQAGGVGPCTPGSEDRKDCRARTSALLVRVGRLQLSGARRGDRQTSLVAAGGPGARRNAGPAGPSAAIGEDTPWTPSSRPGAAGCEGGPGTARAASSASRPPRRPGRRGGADRCPARRGAGGAGHPGGDRTGADRPPARGPGAGRPRGPDLSRSGRVGRGGRREHHAVPPRGGRRRGAGRAHPAHRRRAVGRRRRPGRHELRRLADVPGARRLHRPGHRRRPRRPGGGLRLLEPVRLRAPGRDGAARLPRRPSGWQARRPARGGADRLVGAGPGDPAGRGARAVPGWDLHVRVRVAVPGVRRAAGRLPRPGAPVRVRHHRPGPRADDGWCPRRRPAAAAGRRDACSWVRFARDGDPGWPRYDLEHRATMRFDTSSSVVEDPYARERQLWAGVR